MDPPHSVLGEWVGVAAAELRLLPDVFPMLSREVRRDWRCCCTRLSPEFRRDSDRFPTVAAATASVGVLVDPFECWEALEGGRFGVVEEDVDGRGSSNTPFVG